jgi:L-threonylcarbamoyladenylate synthase
MMDTRVLPTESADELARAVEAAVALLEAGEPVALPTETVYGLAADATNADAVLKIFEAKERPFFDPLIVHLPAIEWLERVARADSPIVAALIEKFWPGPLTLVLPRRDVVPDIVTSGLDTVAVRMSAHAVFREVCSAFGKPLAAPSANHFGRISPTCAEHVVSELDGRIRLVLDGGVTTHGLESTIVAVEPTGLRLLRPGPITCEELESIAPVLDGVHGDKLEAPGQLKSHYAPRTPLRILEHPKSNIQHPTSNVGLLAWREGHASFDTCEVLSGSGDLREAAATLFAKLRRLDEAGLDLILAEAVPEHGLGIAIMDRLRKAAAHE